MATLDDEPPTPPEHDSDLCGPLVPTVDAETVVTTAGGPYSGAALNPARVLGPSMVFHCYWDTVPVCLSDA